MIHVSAISTFLIIGFAFSPWMLRCLTTIPACIRRGRQNSTSLMKMSFASYLTRFGSNKVGWIKEFYFIVCLTVVWMSVFLSFMKKILLIFTFTGIAIFSLAEEKCSWNRCMMLDSAKTPRKRFPKCKQSWRPSAIQIHHSEGNRNLWAYNGRNKVVNTFGR